MIASIVPLIYLSMACVTNEQTACGVVVNDVHDGDTVTVSLPGMGHPIFTREIPVRILGIDAPEMDSKDACEAAKAIKARDTLQSILTKARRVDLQLMQRDKYFRIDADVVADNLSAGQKMLDAGLAIPYDGTTKPKVNWCGEMPVIAK